MADLILYTNPQSRGRIVRWMLEEVGEPYETEIIPYDQMKSERYLSIHPLGKVPGAQAQGSHRHRSARRSAPISPTHSLERVSARAMRRRRIITAGFSMPPGPSRRRSPIRRWDGRSRRSASGCSAMAISTAPSPCSTSFSRLRDYVCGDRFTAADVYVGSQIMFPMQFEMLPERDSFVRYRDRLQARAGLQAGDGDRRASSSPMDRKPPSRSRPDASSQTRFAR